MACEQTICPNCAQEIKLDRGHDGEGGISYCCEYTFEWSREWTVFVTDGNRRSYEESSLSTTRSETKEHP